MKEWLPARFTFHCARITGPCDGREEASVPPGFASHQPLSPGSRRSGQGDHNTQSRLALNQSLHNLDTSRDSPSGRVPTRQWDFVPSARLGIAEART